MKLLHTSDWHLGRTLDVKRRYDEFDQFFNWIFDLIEEEQIDVVLISGDIFETSNPSAKAQEYYFNFLGRMSKSRCRHVVVTAGNHDSPTLLDAPKELLKSLNIHAVGSIGDRYEDEVIVLKDLQNNPFLIVCAVPFLHDRDVLQSFEAGGSIEQKIQNIKKGIQEHYQNVCALAERKRSQLGGSIPVVVMGHLYATGGHMVDGDGVRPLYIGNIEGISTKIFPPGIDYLALGHLHSPQVINDCETIRYSGAPLPMGFAEAKKQKKVIIVEFISDKKPIPKEILIPRFQEIESITGNFDTIQSRINELKATDKSVWVEINLDEPWIRPDIQESINHLISNSKIDVLKITPIREREKVLEQIETDEFLPDLSERDVFERYLDERGVPDDEMKALLESFDEILIQIEQTDPLSEGD